MPSLVRVTCGAIVLSVISFSAIAFAPTKLQHGPLRISKNNIGRRLATSTDNKEEEDSVTERYSSNKSNEEVNFITTALLKNSLFSGLSDTSLKWLVRGFEIKEATRGTDLVTQGDTCDGDYVYLVNEGECKVMVDGKTIPEPYGVVKPAGIFGELGFLYGEIRAATVRARSDTVVYYRVSGELFKDIMSKPKVELQNMRAIDEAINQISGTHSLYGGDVILPYKPERIWLWQQFNGTVLKISIGPTILNMALCVAFVAYARYTTGEELYEIGAGAPDKSLPFVQNLELLGNIWDLEKTLTTFVLTFFLNQSFSFWNKVYQLARDVQGKISDFNLLIVTNAKRDEDGLLTPEAEQLITETSCYSRLFHILMWAGKSERFKILSTPGGLERLESRGLLKPRQLEVLQNSKLAEAELYAAPLEWMMIRANQGMENGHMAGDTATKGMLLKQIVALREKSQAITNMEAGRMPLAYVNLVQVLVDSFVITAPIALYSRLGDYSVGAVFFVTFFYTGLNNLAKIFLDPLNNENYSSGAIFMDLGVFLREVNGQSIEWQKAGKDLPFYESKRTD